MNFYLISCLFLILAGNCLTCNGLKTREKREVEQLALKAREPKLEEERRMEELILKVRELELREERRLEQLALKAREDYEDYKDTFKAGVAKIDAIDKVIIKLRDFKQDIMTKIEECKQYHTASYGMRIVGAVFTGFTPYAGFGTILQAVGSIVSTSTAGNQLRIETEAKEELVRLTNEVARPQLEFKTKINKLGLEKFIGMAGIVYSQRDKKGGSEAEIVDKIISYLSKTKPATIIEDVKELARKKWSLGFQQELGEVNSLLKMIAYVNIVHDVYQIYNVWNIDSETLVRIDDKIREYEDLRDGTKQIILNY